MLWREFLSVAKLTGSGVFYLLLISHFWLPPSICCLYCQEQAKSQTWLWKSSSHSAHQVVPLWGLGTEELICTSLSPIPHLLLVGFPSELGAKLDIDKQRIIRRGNSASNPRNREGKENAWGKGVRLCWCHNKAPQPAKQGALKPEYFQNCLKLGPNEQTP